MAEIESKHDYEEIKKRFFYNGTELASFFAKYPYAEGDRVGEFYKKLVDNAYAWFCGEFCESCKEEFERERNANIQNRFGRSVYRYIADFSVNEEKNVLLVTCDVILKKGKNEILDEWHESHMWNVETQLLSYQKKKKKPRVKN